MYEARIQEQNSHDMMNDGAENSMRIMFQSETDAQVKCVMMTEDSLNTKLGGDDTPVTWLPMKNCNSTN